MFNIVFKAQGRRRANAGLGQGAFSGTRSKNIYNGKEKVLGRDAEILEKVWRLFSFLLTLQLFSCRSLAFGWG